MEALNDLSSYVKRDMEQINNLKDRIEENRLNIVKQLIIGEKYWYITSDPNDDIFNPDVPHKCILEAIDINRTRIKYPFIPIINVMMIDVNGAFCNTAGTQINPENLSTEVLFNETTQKFLLRGEKYNPDTDEIVVLAPNEYPFHFKCETCNYVSNDIQKFRKTEEAGLMYFCKKCASNFII